MTDIEICLRNERWRWSALLENDDGTPYFFDDLARRTAPVVPDDRPFWPRWSADSAFTPSPDFNYFSLPAALLDEWCVYGERWKRLLQLNPRMMIADKLSDVSETHDSLSFPSGWEHVVRDWVREDMPDPAPFDDRNRIDTSAWRQEFMAAAQKAGPGWVFHADCRDVIFEWRWDDD